MMLISHRGNTHGIGLKYENEPKYVEDALQLADGVEVDVWYHLGQFYTGHDGPQWAVKNEWLENDRFFIHAKNGPAYIRLNEMKLVADVFWHDKEPYTYTRKGYVWCYPGRLPAGPNSIAVMPELSHWTIEDCRKYEFVGVVTDYLGKE